MDCTHTVFAMLLLSPCEDASGGSIDLAIAEALAAPERIEADRPSDALRRPDLVLEFFEIAPGMTVLDLFSGAGYYTEILSRLVGDSGKIVAHNNQAYISYTQKTIAPRYAGDRLANVERITAEANDLELPAGTFDAALAMLTWHDFYYADESNGWMEIDEDALVQKLCAAMKPGAVLGISDHVAATGSPVAETAEKLHRIDPQQIRQDLEGSCFEFEGEIDVLRNPADDHAQPMYAGDIRGRTDRVVYKFRKKNL